MLNLGLSGRGDSIGSGRAHCSITLKNVPWSPVPPAPVDPQRLPSLPTTGFAEGFAGVERCRPTCPMECVFW
jgi:hypothetical protein